MQQAKSVGHNAAKKWNERRRDFLFTCNSSQFRQQISDTRSSRKILRFGDFLSNVVRPIAEWIKSRRDDMTGDNVTEHQKKKRKKRF